ncbi:lipopolysaccharide assembly protein LapB [Corallococcus sp. AB011P]|uniref:tetratricopeptide repeat protein n=1 Tax=Corallococcus sp. AB011P TaxID=2316735 RepID=UPI0011C35F8F|nr:hypothetical protein [Corallococcus sp. AB011P]
MSAPSTSPRQGWMLLGGIGVCALTIVAGARSLTSNAEVVFVNALDLPVTVSAGGEHFTLAANEHASHSMPMGPLDVDIQGEKGTLTHETVFVTDESGLFVYNVLGAAPLYQTTVTYSDRSINPPEHAPLVLAGTSFKHVGHIDYVLTNPPESFPVRKRDSGTFSRTHLGQALGGWKTSYGWLVSTHRVAEAARLAEGLREALPETPEIELAAVAARNLVASEEGLHASLAVSRAQRDAHPDDIEAHRMWMHDMRRAGRGDELHAYYQAALEREPGSVLLAVLLARLEPEPAGTERLEALVRDHPGEPLPRRALVGRYMRQQRWAEALLLLDAMEQGDPDYPRYQDMHAEALVALGRRQEAARRLSERLLPVADSKDAVDLEGVLLYAKLVGHASQKGSANEVMRQLIESAQKKRPDGIVAEWLAASLGHFVDAAKLRAVPEDHALSVSTRVLMALAEEPEFAARAFVNADFVGFHRIGREAGTLLAAEFERLGDAALSARVLDASSAELGYGELQDVLSGKLPVESLTMLDWGERAALHLVLARQLDARGQDSKAAYAVVKKEVLLPGAVSIALQNWDRPKPSNAVAGDTAP